MRGATGTYHPYLLQCEVVLQAGRRSGTESSGDASSTDGLPNLAALLSRLLLPALRLTF